MPRQSGTLETLATTLARLLEPLEERLAAGELRFLLAELGLQFPEALETHPVLVNAAKAAVQQAKQLSRLVVELTAAVQAEDLSRMLAKGLELANAIRAAVQGTFTVANALETAGGGMGIPPAELDQFTNELPGRLVEYLVARNLEALPGASPSLQFIGVLERSEQPPIDAQHPAYVRRRVHLDQLTRFIRDPATQLKNMYQWGAPGFTGVALLQALQRVLAQAGVPVVLDTSGPVPVLDLLFLELSPKTSVPQGLRIKVADTVNIDNALPFQQGEWQLRLVLNTQLAVGSEILVKPDDGVIFTPPSGQVQGDTLVEWIGGGAGGQPYLILGQAGGSRLEARQLVARAGVGFAWNPSTHQAEGTFSIGGELRNGKIVVSLQGADGFLGSLFSGLGLESDFSVAFGFSTREGLYFQGSSTLDIQLPLHVSLGPLELRALTLTVGIGDGDFPLGVAVDVKAALGPLQAVIEQLGIQGKLSVPPDKKGNLGPLDFQLGFKPPKGVGLSIDASVIKGGGYLYFDNAKEEYAGAIELTFSGFIALKAIGLISTRMPDGSSGFSLLVIITAEFGTGIQLGFGFTLLAVGGLLGLNRTMRLEPLVEGIRTGAVNSIMFPRDVVANAPKIISDLRAIFPPQQGKFLIGPMAKLGWGTPTLISLSLGIIIEIPGNIAILGVLRVALPDEKAALLILQVSFVGAIEFDKDRLWFFATLFDSRVLTMTLEGEMGLLAAFGEDANFVVSVGGFHPRFEPPPLPFPSPRRVAIDVLNTGSQRIRVEGYFAVTSNTAQFGARAEMYFGFSALNVSGHIGFDALFQFSPFYFIIELSASFGVKVFGIGLFSVSVRLSLEGPTPWRARGTGSISLLFFDIDVDFDVTWGEQRDTTLPPIAVMPLLKAELDKVENWRAQLPTGNNLLVSLRKLPAEDAALVLHPVGVLRVSQRAVPLELTLDKVGNQKPNDVKRLKLEVKTGGIGKKGDVLEQFAPAQFQSLSQTERLSRPAYGPERGGVDLSVSGQQLASSRAVRREVRYETIVLDTNYRRFIRIFFRFTGVLFQFFLRGASVSKSELSAHQKRMLQPFDEKVQVRPEGYTVAYQANNQPFAADSVSFVSEASAREYLASKAVAAPHLAGTLHVIPEFERAV